MSASALHTVKITGSEDSPKIEFTCHGDMSAPCHQYPICGCESWDDDHHHPKVTHELCWIQPWFDNGYISPMAEQGALDDCGYKVGMSGPIYTEFCRDFVEWEFLSAKPSEESL